MQYRDAFSGQRGFTLIEIMITVAAVAILAAIALPSYTQYVQRGNRAQAMAALLKYGNWMQQQYTISNSYQPGGAALALPADADAGTRYVFSISASTASSYTLQAVPVANDKCGTFRLDNTGKRDTKDGKAPAAAATDCWAGR